MTLPQNEAADCDKGPRGDTLVLQFPLVGKTRNLAQGNVRGEPRQRQCDCQGPCPEPCVPHDKTAFQARRIDARVGRGDDALLEPAHELVWLPVAPSAEPKNVSPVVRGMQFGHSSWMGGD